MLQSKKFYKEDIDMFFEDYMEEFHSVDDDSTIEEFFVETLFFDRSKLDEDIENFKQMMDGSDYAEDPTMLSFYNYAWNELEKFETIEEKFRFLICNDILEHHSVSLTHIFQKDIKNHGFFYNRFVEWRDKFYEKEAWKYFDDSSNWY